MFDLWEHAYAARAEAFLKGPDAAGLGIAGGASRLTIHRGDSRATVRAFAGAHPSVKCDLLSVDGGHEHDIAVDDIANMAGLAGACWVCVSRGGGGEGEREQREQKGCGGCGGNGMGWRATAGCLAFLRSRSLTHPPTHPPTAPGAILVVDDSNCDAHWCVDEAVDHHARLGTIKRLFAVAEEPVISEEDGEVYFIRGVTVAQYNNVPV